jgi:hypothetical protein
MAEWANDRVRDLTATVIPKETRKSSLERKERKKICGKLRVGKKRFQKSPKKFLGIRCEKFP